MSALHEGQRPGLVLDEQQDRQIRDENRRALRALRHQEDVYEEPRLSDNGATLAATSEDRFHARLHVATAGAQVEGIPVCRVEGAVIDAPGRFRGLTFINNSVEIRDTTDGAAIFEGCVFEQLVNMAAGTKAHFIGCLFRDAAAVNNLGVAGDAGIIGCHRSSGVVHVAVTTIFETT